MQEGGELLYHERRGQKWSIAHKGHTKVKIEIVIKISYLDVVYVKS